MYGDPMVDFTARMDHKIDNLYSHVVLDGTRHIGRFILLVDTFDTLPRHLTIFTTCHLKFQKSYLKKKKLKKNTNKKKIIIIFSMSFSSFFKFFNQTVIDGKFLSEQKKKTTKTVILIICININ